MDYCIKVKPYIFISMGLFLFFVLQCLGDYPFIMNPSERTTTAYASPPVRGSASESLVFGLPMDINLVTESDLTLLPGIGPYLARAIIEQRELRRGFGSVQELSGVKGLSGKRLARIIPYISVQGRASSRVR